MANVVLVHGIAQEQGSADTLEDNWLPALAGGVRNAGHAGRADQLRDSPHRGINVRMAYYGDLYLAPDAQGGVADYTLTPNDEGLAEELGRV